MHQRAALILTVLLLLASSVPASAGDAGLVVDVEKARAAVRDADRAFAATLESRNLMRFQWFLAADAVFLGDGVHRGPGEIAEAWAIFFNPKAGASISWRPTEISVAASGELAYTIGDAEVRMPGQGGEPSVQPGRFLTLWRKDETQAWKVLATGALVVCLDPALGEIRDRLAALAEVWPPLQPLDAEMTLVSIPESVLESASGELAATIGSYRVEARRGAETSAAAGGYLRLWTREDDGAWRAVAEALSPPR